jgi:hypothetical protein
MSLFQLFRKKPSDDVIDELLTATGFNTLEDPKKVNRTYLESEAVINNYVEMQQKLAPFYIPCKAKKYLITEPTPKNMITVIRQFLKIKCHTVMAHEKYHAGNKMIIYRIAPRLITDLNDEHVIKFD